MHCFVCVLIVFILYVRVHTKIKHVCCQFIRHGSLLCSTFSYSQYPEAKNISIYLLVLTLKVCKAIYSILHLKIHCKCTSDYSSLSL